MILRSETDQHGSLPSGPATNGQPSTSRSSVRAGRRTGRANLLYIPPEDVRAAARAPSAEMSSEAVAMRDESEEEWLQRPGVKFLKRSKSDFAPRIVDDYDSDSSRPPDGARHGFQHHYQSEQILSVLASVCLQLFLLLDPVLGPAARSFHNDHVIACVVRMRKLQETSLHVKCCRMP